MTEVIWGGDGPTSIPRWDEESKRRRALQSAELARLRAIDDEATELYWVMRDTAVTASLHLTSQKPPEREGRPVGWVVVPLCGAIYEGVNYTTRGPSHCSPARPDDVRQRPVCRVCGRRRKGRAASPDAETDEEQGARVAMMAVGWLMELHKNPLADIAERIRPLDPDLAADLQRLGDDYVTALRILQGRAREASYER